MLEEGSERPSLASFAHLLRLEMLCDVQKEAGPILASNSALGVLKVLFWAATPLIYSTSLSMWAMRDMIAVSGERSGGRT